MRTYIVSLYVVTKQISLHELSERLGRAAGCSSHDKGSLHVSSKPTKKVIWPQTIWKMESRCDKSAPLARHVASVLRRLPSLNLERGNLPRDCSLTLDIAVMSDDAYACEVIGPSWVKVLAEHNMALEISWYPTNFAPD